MIFIYVQIVIEMVKFDVKFNIIFVMKVVFLENLVMMVFYVGDI